MIYDVILTSDGIVKGFELSLGVTNDLVFERIDDGKYKEAVDMCNIIAEMRSYIASNVRENMSKPENINYIEVE